jgi:hypothetical protein
MADEVQICNLALLRVGVTSTIAALSEVSTEANACRVFFEQVRDAVLRDFPWGFATKRAALGLLAEAAPTNWAYAYQLPSDCLLVRGLVCPGARSLRADQRIPYEVNGRKLFTDMPEAELLYTARVTDTSVFDPLAVSAIAWGMAVELGNAFLKPDLARAAQQVYQLARSEAWAACLNEGHDAPPESEFLSVRN